METKRERENKTVVAILRSDNINFKLKSNETKNVII